MVKVGLKYAFQLYLPIKIKLGIIFELFSSECFHSPCLANLSCALQ